MQLVTVAIFATLTTRSSTTKTPLTAPCMSIAGNLNASESIQGYDLYSGTIADLLSEPSLHTPITIGLYAKWGSGKSILIDKLTSKSLCAFQSMKMRTEIEKFAPPFSPNAMTEATPSRLSE